MTINSVTKITIFPNGGKSEINFLPYVLDIIHLSKIFVQIPNWVKMMYESVKSSKLVLCRFGPHQDFWHSGAPVGRKGGVVVGVTSGAEINNHRLVRTIWSCHKTSCTHGTKEDLQLARAIKYTTSYTRHTHCTAARRWRRQQRHCWQPVKGAVCKQQMPYSCTTVLPREIVAS